MNISIEGLILTVGYLSSIMAFVVLLRKKPLEAQVVFLFHQMPTWVMGLVVVEAGWLAYPVREFQRATHASFLFEYLSFPVIAGYFVAYYPNNRGIVAKLMYFTAITLAIAVPEWFIERYTQLIKYVTWSWPWTFISVWIFFYVSLLFYRWFIRIYNPAT